MDVFKFKFTNGVQLHNINSPSPFIASNSQSLQFSPFLSQASVPETYVAGGYPRPAEGFVEVMCIDSVGMAANNVTYSTESNPGPFQLSATTGMLSVTADLDYETTTFYNFTVICTNITNPNIIGLGMVQIDVLPVNEFDPVLSRSSLLTILFENVPVGTVIASTEPGSLLQYIVTDGDDGPDGNITFTLSEGSQDNTENSRFFELDFITGSLVLRQRLDIDNIPNAFDRVALRITACDVYPPGEQCPNLLVSLIVFSANDNSPQFSAESYEVSYPESIPVGTLIITAICTDNDRGAGEFSGIEIYRPTSELWQLPNSQNGTVFLNKSLDYERVQMHEFTLCCVDTGGREAFAIVTVNVLPMNDNKPQFNQAGYEFVMNCITSVSVVGRVKAIDLDLGSGGTITYSMEGNDNFAIDANEGTIFPYNYGSACEGSYFNMTVVASDGVFNDTAQVIITVSGPLSIIEITAISLGGLVVILFVCACICCMWKYGDLASSRR